MQKKRKEKKINKIIPYHQKNVLSVQTVKEVCNRNECALKKKNKEKKTQGHTFPS